MLIPKEEYNTFKSAISYHTKIKCVDWPMYDRVSPKKHSLLSRDAVVICRSNSLMPVTQTQSSVEPQMIAEHIEYAEDNLYKITRPYFEPAYISGSSLVRVDMETVATVNKLARSKTFVALQHTERSLYPVEYHITQHSRLEKCVKISVWEQPHRVKHTNGFLILEIGLLVG